MIIILVYTRGIIKKICSKTDFLAGTCLTAVMVLILANIIMRKVFSSPIMAAYDLVGLLTATAIGLALANCAWNDFHIAVDILVNKFSQLAQQILNIGMKFISLAFFALVIRQMFVLGSKYFTNGTVSPTAEIPMYPFVFILCFNVFCLCLVLAVNIADSFKNASKLIKSTQKKRKVSE